MSSRRPWLGIDYGSAYTKAVLVMPDGRSTPLSFDGGVVLSNAAHVGPSGAVVGAAAWQRLESEPDGFLLSPLRAGEESVPGASDGGVDLAVIVAAGLRRVTDQASTVAGEPVDDVRMVVPAEWGPRRRTWWRRVAGKAGLGQVSLVEAPIAAARRLDQVAQVAAGARWLVVDVGAGCEVSVVRKTTDSEFEVLSTLADADAGGDRIDNAILEAVAEQSGAQRSSMLAGVREAKHTLSEQPAVTVPMPGRPPVVVTSSTVRQAAKPVFERAGVLAAEAVANADMTLEDLDAVHAVGAAMATPGSAEMIASTLGEMPKVSDQAAFAAVLGAADAGPESQSRVGPETMPEVMVPSFWRLVELAVPGVLSLLLYAHFVLTADFNNGTPDAPRRGYYVMANWGELTVAAALALVTGLRAAALISTTLRGWPAVDDQRGGHDRAISSGIGAAIVGGLAAASFYGLTASVYFALPVGELLRWSLAPLLPIAVCAAGMAVVGWRHRPPEGRWDSVLAFPLSSSVAAALGVFAISGWWHGHLPVWMNSWSSLLGYIGALLMSVALACALTRHLWARVVLGLLLGFFCVIISRAGPALLAVTYAVAIAEWWGRRAWTVFRDVRSDSRQQSMMIHGAG